MKKHKLVKHIEDLVESIEIDKSTIDHLIRDRNNLSQRVDELVKERDEARRMVCRMVCYDSEDNCGDLITAEEWAKRWGWDCFKEDK